MSVPEYMAWSFDNIINKIDAKELNLNPEYQRLPVWSLDRQKGLIKSLLRNLPIPNITVSCISLQKFNCIDGQQRCYTVHSFINNKFSIEKDNKEVLYKDMNIRDQVHILHMKFPVTICYNMTPQDEAEYYECINRGLKLSNGELIQSYIYTPLIKSIMSLFTNTPNEIVSPLLQLLNIWGPLPQAGKRNPRLATFSGIFIGLSEGPAYITTSFSILQPILDKIDYNFDKLHSNLKRLVHICTNMSIVIPTKWKSKAKMWSPGFLLGYIITSLWESDDDEYILEAWKHILSDAIKNNEILVSWGNKIDKNNKSRNLTDKRLIYGWNLIEKYHEDGIDAFNKASSENDDNESIESEESDD